MDILIWEGWIKSWGDIDMGGGNQILGEKKIDLSMYQEFCENKIPYIYREKKGEFKNNFWEIELEGGGAQKH
jgi:hypothetical protein